MEHSITSATALARERTPWHAVQVAAREVLREAEAAPVPRPKPAPLDEVLGRAHNKLEQAGFHVDFAAGSTS